MAIRKLLIIITFAALVCSSEIEDGEHKKRGVKGTALNSVSTSAQKPDYTYSIYTQNPSTQSATSSQAYQNQVPNSYYPSQGSSQYYTSGNSQADTSQTYPAQSQVNATPQQGTSHYLPINYVPSPGYLSRYQVAPSKTPSNAQVAFVPQPNHYPQQQIFAFPQIPHSYFSPNTANQVHPHHNAFVSQIPQFNYQPLSLGSLFGHPSGTVVLGQSSQPAHNNLLYPNPVQNYFTPASQSNQYSQSKYSSYGSPVQSEYDKVQGALAQTKEENEIVTQNTEYAGTSDPNSSYKNSYSGRSAYAKLSQ
ncbi:RNA-binding protein EWS [Bombyx mori]|uniref:Cuticle protein n=1 Tax=Bombyx mori TaxID=7091 RepID=A0A8R1WHY8_BOMMO|nr:RNA-binding protein EWS [Bombyx mori]